jgi:hypothetical protein
MRMRVTHSFVIPLAIVAVLQSAIAVAQQPTPEPLTDVDAYAVYAEVLPKRGPDETLLIREETVRPPCRQPLTTVDPVWKAVLDNFTIENARVRTLVPLLQLVSSYLLIPSSDIKAEGARLAALYPGIWQRRPGATDYAEVSAVGFDSTKTRAIVSMGFGASGSVHAMEKRDGRWGDAVVMDLGVCGWIA